MVTCPCDAQQLERAIALLDKHEWTVMVRTVNGADVHAAVDAFEQVVTAIRAIARPAPPARRQPADRRPGAHPVGQQLAGRATRSARGARRRRSAPGELRNAIDAYTSHAAYASYDEHRKGTLARGMLADIVILSNDIFDS